MEISKEQKLLLNLIAMSLSDQPEKLKLSNEELSGVDFVKVAKESIYQGCFVLLCLFARMEMYSVFYLLGLTMHNWFVTLLCNPRLTS